jgi:polyisoprenoid-binding protein YceI
MSVSLARRELEVGLVPAGTWRIDPARSSVVFEIKDMRIATVKGRFTAFEGVRPAAGGSFGMFGNLTIKGVSRPIALTVTVAEVSVDPWGHERLALAAHGEVDRKEFGLTWSQAL